MKGPSLKIHTLNLQWQDCGNARVNGIHLRGGSIQARPQRRAGCAKWKDPIPRLTA